MKFDCTEDNFLEFEYILHLYMDFLQKEKVPFFPPFFIETPKQVIHMLMKFKKLQQLREAQQKLPIFKYQEAILKTIKENQITIIAGDTGCGKVNKNSSFLSSHYLLLTYIRGI